MSANLRVAVQALHRERFTAVNRIKTMRRTAPPTVRRPSHRADSPVARIEQHIARLDVLIQNVERLAASASKQGERTT